MADVDTLRTDIVSWLADRTDIIPNVDTFIILAEADFNDDIRVREMEKTASIVQAGNGSYPLPDDFLEWREADLAGVTRPLKLVGEDFFAMQKGALAPGPAKYMLLRGNSVFLSPEPDDINLQLRYYGKIPSLIDGNNWLYTRRPGAYLFSCCRYAARFLQNGELEDRMFADSQKEVAKLLEADGRNRWSKTTNMFQGSRP